MIDYLINYLIAENSDCKNNLNPKKGNKELFRILTNIKKPKKISETFLYINGKYINEICSKKGIVNCESIEYIEDNKNIVFCRGNITTLFNYFDKIRFNVYTREDYDEYKRIFK